MVGETGVTEGYDGLKQKRVVVTAGVSWLWKELRREKTERNTDIWRTL